MAALIAASLLGGLLMWFADRRERSALFPTQICRYCPMEIHYDFRHYRWVHENGEMRTRTPRTQTGFHIAFPSGQTF